MLRWHYRSKHESLIAFSNRWFYESKLIIFPSAWAKHEHLGIKFIYVPEGVYDRGGKRDNRREAEVVTDLVFEHFARYPDKTLGVVTFSIVQMTAIEDEVEQRLRSRPELERFFKDGRLEGFFVKNLENVQGDERDVMIFSVGYGKDQQRRITMNFGPLNKPGGERRLNVAVTRAREKVILVSSIRAADIDLSKTQAPGVLQLYRYLDYAERGEVALELTYPQGGEPESDLESDVAGEIRRLGYDVVHQAGCSGYRIDLGVVDPAEPGRFLLGVECDGATYHSAYTARDRDRLRQQVLEGVGWRIHRIWSPDWAVRRQTEVERLKRAIEEARQFASRGDSVQGSTPSIDQVNNVLARTERIEIMTPKGGNIPGTVPYKVAGLRPRGRVGRDFHLPQWRQEQCRLLDQLVREEGPVHIDYAARRIISAWGLERTGSRIVDAIMEAVTICQEKGSLRRKGKFLFGFRI
jgi:very-short-patch-repair endonuclease